MLIISKTSMADVIGYLDSIIEDSNKILVNGWACDKNTNNPIDVHIHVNVNEELIASGKTNVSNESIISDLCGTNGVKHRFSIEIPEDKLRKYQGKAITAYGFGYVKRQLKLSRGIITVPNSNITGYLDALYQKEGKFYIRGWACQKGINQSIKVRAYVGSSAFEGGTYAFQGLADKELNSKISSVCNTINVPHRFVIQIPKSVVLEHKGKKIIIHGINTSGGRQSNEVLKRTKMDYFVPSIHPTVFEEIIEGLDFHPLHYYSDKNYKAVTNGKVYNIIEQSKIEINDGSSLRGAHSIASDGNDFFSAKAVTDVKTGDGAIVQIDMDELETVTSFKITTANYSLLSPHDIIFNKEDGYYYYIDSHWNSSSDYLVRFKYNKGKLVNSKTEAFKLNSLSSDTTQKFYARSLSIYKDEDDNTQKIIIGVSSHGQVILVDSFDDSLSNANFKIKEIISINRKGSIDKIAPSGSYDTTGFVFNDVEYYKGYFYGTNFFKSKHCQSEGCADKFRFVRWKTWDDFKKDNIEDLSYLIQKKRIPYYLSNTGENLYLTTIPDTEALEAEKMVPKIYVINQK